MFRPKKANSPPAPERPSLRAVLLACAGQFERDLLALVQAHDPVWIEAQDESATEVVLVRAYALFWFVADEVLRRQCVEDDYHRRQDVIAGTVKEALAAAFQRHREGDLPGGEGLMPVLSEQFLDLREAYLHRLKAALERGLNRNAALADAWARLMLAMLMATIDEEVTQSQQAVVTFLKAVRRMEEKLRQAYDQGR